MTANNSNKNSSLVESDDSSGTAEPSLDEMRCLVRVVLWAALIGAGGWITVPLPLIPITLQTFFMVLAGLVEGPKGGAMAGGLYLLAGFLGLPVFAGGVGGPSVILGPSAGFALAFPLLGAMAGLASRRRAAARGKPAPGMARMFLVSFFCAIPLFYLCGYLGLLINAKLEPLVAVKAISVFMPGEVLKCLVAASLASSRLFR